jgi:hypothetical protein
MNKINQIINKDKNSRQNKQLNFILIQIKKRHWEYSQFKIYQECAFWRESVKIGMKLK